MLKLFLENLMISQTKHKSYSGARMDLLELDYFDFSNKTILDIGCYQGANAKYLKEKYDKVRFIGLEGNAEAISNAYVEVDEIHQVDLDNIDFSILNKTNVDFIILGDVLEHLKEPDVLMIKIKKIIHQDTLIIVSIPNIQYYETFLQLLLGKFPRRERGIFDKTHLRWFTYKEFKKMLEDDYEIIKFSRSFRLVDGNCCRYLNRLNKYLRPLFFLFAPFFTYQMKFILKLKEEK